MNRPIREDHLLERKTDRQLKEIRRTAVAFANSVRPGHTAAILIGEGNDGSVSGIPIQTNFKRRFAESSRGFIRRSSGAKLSTEATTKTASKSRLNLAGKRRTLAMPPGLGEDQSPLPHPMSN